MLNMRLVELQCAHQKHCHPGTLMWVTSHLSGLTRSVRSDFLLGNWLRLLGGNVYACGCNAFKRAKKSGQSCFSLRNSLRLKVRSEKLQNESSPNFEFPSRILPRISLCIFPECFWCFRASFGGKRRPEKIHPQNSRRFSMQISQVRSKKKSTKAFSRVGKLT